MPYPAQVTPERIVEQAAEMIEAEGVEALSLGRLASALGIKAPSLYRYFEGKTALLRAVNLATNEQLVAAMHTAADAAADDAYDRLLTMMRAYRTFAHTRPAAYMLAYGDTTAPPDPDALLALALPLQAAVAAWSGEAGSLPALRGLWALVHGYVALELTRNFQRGGDLDATFDQIVRTYLAGLKTLAE
ncbi:MAG: TetR/AcrR family transcriptional regulator [Anaerolineae bacterium]|nr:TetR/AcrR family transcriptional regulator [Anaerolineae bacterium]